MTSRLASPEIYPPAQRMAYLDAASVGLMHAGAARSINAWQEALAQEGTIAFDEEAEVRILDDLSSAAARLFNAGPTDIAIASGETPLMASLAWAVSPPAGSCIVTSEAAHPSTIYPWMRVAEATKAELRWARGEGHYVAPETIEALIDERTAVVCLSHVEYGTGQLHDLARFAERAHAHGALLVVDATQSAGQVPIDVEATGVDAVVSSTYKWVCGPFGAGVMYLAPHLQETSPGIVGWRSHENIVGLPGRSPGLSALGEAIRVRDDGLRDGPGRGGSHRLPARSGHRGDRLAQPGDRGGAAPGAHGPRRGHPVAAESPRALRNTRRALSGPRQPRADRRAGGAGRGGITAPRLHPLAPHLYNDSEDVEKALSALRTALAR